MGLPTTSARCPLIVGVVTLTAAGIVLVFYGRNRFLRSIGALLGSIPGLLLAWVSVWLTTLGADRQLWSHMPPDGEIWVIGQDITIGELIWVPLQNVGCYLIFPVLLMLVAFWLDRIGRRKKQHTFLVLLEEVLFGSPVARILEKSYHAAKIGCLVHQVLLGVSLVLMLPVTGALAYAILQFQLMDGQVHYIEDWMEATILGVSTVFGLAYFFTNEMIALRLLEPKAQQAQGKKVEQIDGKSAHEATSIRSKAPNSSETHPNERKTT